MNVISPGTTFCASGAVVLTEQEVATVIHALTEEHDRVVRAHGSYYGGMTIRELDIFISQWQEYQKARGWS